MGTICTSSKNKKYIKDDGIASYQKIKPISQPPIKPISTIESMQDTQSQTKLKKGMVQDIEYEKTEEEIKEYEELNKNYVKEMSEIETYGIYSAMEGLSDISSYSSYKTAKADVTGNNLKKIMKEIRKQLPKNIITSINGSMFIRFDENNPRFIRALLSGIDDTCYQNGLFLFDIYLSNNYPQSPLIIKHITKGATLCHANNGPGGFSPNLHQTTGKVCLSLLGTWSGPGWQSDKSNTYQVLSSIMLMILGAKHAYYMEPGHGGWEGTVNGRKIHQQRVIDYDEEVMYHTAKYAILETIKTPYVGFQDVIKTHFRVKHEWIVKTIQTWINNENYSQGFKNKMKPVLKEIKEELNKL